MKMCNLKFIFTGITAITLLGLSSAGCRFNTATSTTPASPLVITEKTQTQYLIVTGNENKKNDEFAMSELQSILKQSTGVSFNAISADSPEAVNAGKRIVVGKSKLARKLLGDDLVDSLKAQESLVTSRGNDLILIGGDNWGTLYAVYDFVENEVGYRNFLPAPGGERFVKTENLVFSGKETRRTMAFKGYRDGHPKWWPGFDPHATAAFFFRNRMNLLNWFQDDTFAKGSGLQEEFYFENHCHGFGMFFDWEKTFTEHPDYYTMNKDGKRISNAQLCLSSADCRRYLTGKVLDMIKEKHPQGINCYVVASNDFQGSRYCWCPNCLALEEKYNSVGGPLWDYILELCTNVKKDYPDVFISSLAYKGPQQTEKAPDNIVFPDNFIVDCAFLNTTQTLKEFPAETLENGERFQKYENLLKWGKITKHVSYWFYALGGPIVIYERPQKELQELRDAGVESIFHCGFGGDLQFGAISRYVTLRLMIDPDQDSKALATEAAEFLYGAATPMMMAHIDEMEQLRKISGLAIVENNPYPGFNILKPEQILRWRKDFDKMEELTKNDQRRNLFVRQARTAVDIWTVIFLLKIQKEFPDFKPDIQKIIDKGLATCDELVAAKIIPKSNNIQRAFESMQLFAYLKNDSVPIELQGYPKDKIIRHLPEKIGNISPVPDADAITGYALKAKIPANVSYNDGVAFEFYDAAERKWLLSGKNAKIQKTEIVPNRYKLYKVGTARLPKSLRFVTGSLWGSELDLETMGRYYDPTYHNRNYEIWISLKFEGPKFESKSQAADSFIFWDQIFLVDKGVVE